VSSTRLRYGSSASTSAPVDRWPTSPVPDFLATLAKKPGARAGGLPSARTLNRHANTIATMFKWAIGAGLFNGDNPATGHRRPEGNGRKRHPFTVVELARAGPVRIGHRILLRMGAEERRELRRGVAEAGEVEVRGHADKLLDPVGEAEAHQ
jgi:hypothetical protein